MSTANHPISLNFHIIEEKIKLKNYLHTTTKEYDALFLMCCVLLAVCISNALLFQTLCTPADETPETSSPTGNKKDKKKDEKKDAAKVRFSFVVV
jgi:hypothetical protein